MVVENSQMIVNAACHAPQCALDGFRILPARNLAKVFLLVILEACSEALQNGCPVLVVVRPI